MEFSRLIYKAIFKARGLGLDVVSESISRYQAVIVGTIHLELSVKIASFDKSNELK